MVWLRHIKKILFPLLTLLLVYLLIEFLLLVFDPFLGSQGFYGFDPDMGFRVNPGARYSRHRANRFGFNDKDYPLGEHPGVFRALILGDSFNWMGGPICNYTRILDRKLAERFGRDRVQIINAGYSATHTAQQLEALRKFGLQYRPDLVILGFFAGNDLVDGSPYKIRVGWIGTTTDVDTRKDFYTVLWNRPVLFRSRLLALLRDRYLQWRSSSEVLYPLPRLETPEEFHEFCKQVDAATPPQLSEEEYIQLARYRMEIGYRKRESFWEENESYILDALGKMDGLVLQSQAAFMVVTYPAEFQVDPAFRSRILQAAGRQETDYIDAYSQKLVGEYCRSHGIEFHDLLPSFRKAQHQGQTLYLPRNTHWNWEGNFLTAEYLYKLIAPRVQDFLSEG